VAEEAVYLMAKRKHRGVGTRYILRIHAHSDIPPPARLHLLIAHSALDSLKRLVPSRSNHLSIAPPLGTSLQHMSLWILYSNLNTVALNFIQSGVIFFCPWI
jgi:hypothetical protein